MLHQVHAVEKPVQEQLEGTNLGRGPVFPVSTSWSRTHQDWLQRNQPGRLADSVECLYLAMPVCGPTNQSSCIGYNGTYVARSDMGAKPTKKKGTSYKHTCALVAAINLFHPALLPLKVNSSTKVGLGHTDRYQTDKKHAGIGFFFF